MTTNGKNGTMTNNPSNYESVALVDESTHIEDLERIFKINNTKIITFDIKSHKKLEKKNIPHEISDIFLVSKEIDEIQQKCYSFAHWANSSKIEKFFQYKGLNLENFFYQEIFIFLIPFLKKLIETQKILEKYSNATFMSSGLLKQLINLQNKPCSIITNQKFESHVFQNDYIKLQNNLLEIKISRSNYFKFKKLMENIIGIIFGPKKNSKNGIILTEFNTIQYNSLLFELSQNHLNPIFYGRKRPAIWNLDSFRSIKNSKTTIFTENDLMNSNIQSLILSDTEKILPKILSVLENHDYFENFFVINKISFWKIIQPFIINLSQRRISEAIKEINLAKNLLEKTKPKCILVLSESSHTDQFIISQAKKQKIPVILIQHGVGGSDGPESNVINEFTGSMPILSDEFLVWGNAAKKYANKFGINEKIIHELGSSAHDKIFTHSNNNKLKKDFILISAGSATTNHIKDYFIDTHKEYENTLKEICKSILKTKKKIIIKMHPYLDGKIEKDIVKEIDPEIQVITKGNISSLIESCELMITLAVTSAALDAQVLGKPVIRLPIKEWWGPPDTYRTSPGLTVPIEEFETILNKVLNDRTFRQQIVDNGKIFVNDCLANQGTSAKSIAKFLKNYE
jgi:hypothetical protein